MRHAKTLALKSATSSDSEGSEVSATKRPVKAVLQGKGSVSNAEMESQVNAVYEEVNARRKAQEALEADQEDLIMLEEIMSKTNSK